MPFSDDEYACPCTHDHEPTLLSFEVMPPRKPSLEEPFWNTVDQLLRVRPDVMSVTYGAGGKDRSNARSTVHRLVRDTPIQPIAHLTCVGNSTEEVVSTVYDYLDLGVRTFLGKSYQYEVNTAAGVLKVNMDTSNLFREGQEIRLYLPKDKLVLVRR